MARRRYSFRSCICRLPRNDLCNNIRSLLGLGHTAGLLLRLHLQNVSTHYGCNTRMRIALRKWKVDSIHIMYWTGVDFWAERWKGYELVWLSEMQLLDVGSGYRIALLHACVLLLMEIILNCAPLLQHSIIWYWSGIRWFRGYRGCNCNQTICLIIFTGTLTGHWDCCAHYIIPIGELKDNFRQPDKW